MLYKLSPDFTRKMALQSGNNTVVQPVVFGSHENQQRVQGSLICFVCILVMSLVAVIRDLTQIKHKDRVLNKLTLEEMSAFDKPHHLKHTAAREK